MTERERTRNTLEDTPGGEVLKKLKETMLTNGERPQKEAPSRVLSEQELKERKTKEEQWREKSRNTKIGRRLGTSIQRQKAPDLIEKTGEYGKELNQENDGKMTSAHFSKDWTQNTFLFQKEKNSEITLPKQKTLAEKIDDEKRIKSQQIDSQGILKRKTWERIKGWGSRKEVLEQTSHFIKNSKYLQNLVDMQKTKEPIDVQSKPNQNKQQKEMSNAKETANTNKETNELTLTSAHGDIAVKKGVRFFRYSEKKRGRNGKKDFTRPSTAFTVVGFKGEGAKKRILLQADGGNGKIIEYLPEDMQKKIDQDNIAYIYNTDEAKEAIAKINPTENKKKDSADTTTKTDIKKPATLEPATPGKKETILEGEKAIEEIAKLFKKGIDRVVVHGKEVMIDGKKQLLPEIDLDTKMALFLLNNSFDSEAAPHAKYKEGAYTEVVPKGSEAINKTNKNEVIVHLDTGERWLSVETGGSVKKIYLDHHGSGKRADTSATLMVAKVLNKIGVLEQKPAWMAKMAEFVNEVDNLSYLDDTDDKGKRSLTPEVLKEKWPESLYGLYQDLPFGFVKNMFEKGNDPIHPFSKKELAIKNASHVLYEDSATKKKFTTGELLNIINKRREKVIEALDGVSAARAYMEKKGLALETPELGKVVYHNFTRIPSKTDPKKTVLNTIPFDLGFIASKVLGNDTFVVFNPQPDKKSYFINTQNEGLDSIASLLPKGTKDIRGTFVFPPKDKKAYKNFTEDQFLKIIGLKESNAAAPTKEQVAPAPKQALTPEEKKGYEEELARHERNFARAEKINDQKTMAAARSAIEKIEDMLGITSKKKEAAEIENIKKRLSEIANEDRDRKGVPVENERPVSEGAKWARRMIPAMNIVASAKAEYERWANAYANRSSKKGFFRRLLGRSETAALGDQQRLARSQYIQAMQKTAELLYADMSNELFTLRDQGKISSEEAFDTLQAFKENQIDPFLAEENEEMKKIDAIVDRG